MRRRQRSRHRRPPSPERRQLTVVQCGLCGPALASARRDPEDLQHLLAVFHERAKPVVTEAGGTVDRLLGDGLLVYFGHPQADEHQGVQGLRGALRPGDDLILELQGARDLPAMIENPSRMDAGRPPGPR